MKITKFLSAFQLFFYPGSHVRQSNYQPLLQQVQHNLQQNVSVVDRSFFRPHVITNDSILIGHSFGGYFALLDMIKYRDHVKGAILLNSHFNSRNKAFYPGIPQSSIDEPVLVILGGKDKRLPLAVGIDDLFEKIKERRYDKHYIINQDFDHFGGMTGNLTEETFLLADQISEFIEGISRNDYSKTMLRSNDSCYDPKIDTIVPSSVIVSRSLSLMDALWSLVLPHPMWEALHWVLFLLAKPDDYLNYVYETDTDIYLKTRNVPRGALKLYLDSVVPRDKLSIQYVQLPSIHTAVLAWLFVPLLVYKNKKSGVVTCPVLEYPIKNVTTYYRLPHPHRIFEKLI